MNQLERRQRLVISAYTQILAGLKYEKDLIRQLFREGMMRESVIYQEILPQGEQRGEQREQIAHCSSSNSARGRITPRGA